jgi:hypothetical protein
MQIGIPCPLIYLSSLRWDDGALAEFQTLDIQDNYHDDGRVQIAMSNFSKGLP